MKIGKTVIGAAGLGICSVLSVAFPPAALLFLTLQKTVFGPLVVVGLGDKLDKVRQALPPPRM